MEHRVKVLVCQKFKRNTELQLAARLYRLHKLQKAILVGARDINFGDSEVEGMRWIWEMSKNNGRVVYVENENGYPVAMCVVEAINQRQDRYLVHGLYVAHDSRRRGMAKAMLAVIEYIQGSHELNVFGNNLPKPARALFESFNYQPGGNGGVLWSQRQS